MSPAIWCVDGFYPDAERVREVALQGPWEAATGTFTGTQTRIPGFPMALVIDRVQTLLGAQVRYDPQRPAVFRSLTRSQFEAKRRIVHVDRMGLACIICLSHETGPTSFTMFYRHRETGLTGVGSRRDLFAAALRARCGVRRLRRRLDDDGADEGRWEVMHRVAYRFNRLIVFDSDLFHSAGGTAGETLEAGKLTQNFNCWLRATPTLAAAQSDALA